MVDLLGHGRFSVADLAVQLLNLLPQFNGDPGLRLNCRQSDSELLILTRLYLQLPYAASG